jgi:enamine deaminase RidA (YjgF/YER057c/UK114 family)
MSDIQRHGRGPFAFSQVVVHGGVAYLAGQVASDPEGSFDEQVRSVLARIDELLASVGSDKSRLLSVTVWLRDMTDFAAMNAAWEEWIDSGNLPVRATVRAELARPEILVEMAAIASI